MKRTTIPVLLVVLTLLCGPGVSAAVAGTVDQDGALAVPTLDRQSTDPLLDLYGDTGDGRKGDPSTLGDGFGVADDDPILNSDQSSLGSDTSQLLQVLIQLMEYFTVLH